MRKKFAFDPPLNAPDGHGGTETGWDTNNAVTRYAEIIFQRGSESIDAARLAGAAIYKLRLHASPETRRITPDWRARDLGLAAAAVDPVPYNVRTADTQTDPQWVYLEIESGVAV